MTVVFLLVVIATLLYARHPQRDYTLSAALLIAALTWLAIEIHLLRILHDVFALAIANWVDVVMALGAAVLLVVPAVMLSIAVHDRMERRDGRAEFYTSIGPPPVNSVPINSVLNKFERRVATLIALGYGRTQAEITAVHQMKRDLSHQRGARQH